MATAAANVPILIVEDEAAIADTVHFALAREAYSPHWVSTGEAALAHLQVNATSLIILDVGLPDLSGFELYKRLRQLPQCALTPVVFLTARSEEIDRVVGLELGADDYIAKPFSPRELVARIRGILRRSTPTAQAEAHKPLVIDETKRQVRYFGTPLSLSRYEFGLLVLLNKHPGRVYTRDELLRLVWDDDNDSFDRTVDAHIKTLRAKLKAITPAHDAIRTVRGSGYALSEEWPPMTKQM